MLSTHLPFFEPSQRQGLKNGSRRGIFRAALGAPIVVNDRVMVPAGANVKLKLIHAKSAGHMTGRSELGLQISSISFQGKTHHVASSKVRRVGTSRRKQTAERVCGAAALGALIGAITEASKGAEIGAAQEATRKSGPTANRRGFRRKRDWTSRSCGRLRSPTSRAGARNAI